MLKLIRNSIGAVALLALAACEQTLLSSSAVFGLKSHGLEKHNGGTTTLAGVPFSVETYSCPQDRCPSLPIVQVLRTPMPRPEVGETIEQRLRAPGLAAEEAARLIQYSVKFDDQPAKLVSHRLVAFPNHVALYLSASGAGRTGRARYSESRVVSVNNVIISVSATGDTEAEARKLLDLATNP